MSFILLYLALAPAIHEPFSHSHKDPFCERFEEVLHWHIPYESLPAFWQVNISDPSCSELFWDYLLVNRKIEGKCPLKALKHISSVLIYIKIPEGRRHCKEIRIRVDFPLDHPEFFWKEFAQK